MPVLTHKEIIELMQTTVGHAIDDTIDHRPDRRHMLAGLDMGALCTVMTFVSSFHPDQINPTTPKATGDTTRFELTIKRAIADLGPLSIGQRVDLLLDNHSELRDSDHAREILVMIQSKYGGHHPEPTKIRLIYPEKRLVTEEYILTRHADAVANGDIVGATNDIEVAIYDLEDIGQITVARGEGGS